MASRNILTDVLSLGLTISGIGVGAGVVFGIVFARGIGRYVSEVHVPGMLHSCCAGLRHSGRSGDRVGCARRAAPVNAVEALRSE